MTADLIMNALPLPVLTVGEGGKVLNANTAAESFFDASLRVMQRQRLSDLVPFGSPVVQLVEEVRSRGASVSEYRIDIGTPRIGSERIVWPARERSRPRATMPQRCGTVGGASREGSRTDRPTEGNPR